jgi:hypothetical protein
MTFAVALIHVGLKTHTRHTLGSSSEHIALKNSKIKKISSFVEHVFVIKTTYFFPKQIRSSFYIFLYALCF